jgi:CelD/BcsL family acetyltransferase involved in cellulose biosynthesis
MATPSRALADTPVRATEVSLSDLRWLAFTASHPDALCFHRPAWADLLADCYGYRPFVLAVEGDRGQIAAGVPVVEVRRLGRKHWRALPFSDYCPPLFAPGGAVDRAAFTRELERARGEAGARSFEVRAPLAGADDHSRREAVIHRTRLEGDSDALFARFHRSQVQRNVRRAERERVVVRRAESAVDLTRSFYDLQLQTRRRLGMPMQPRRFFAALWSHLLEPEHGFLLLAYAGRTPVAGAVFLAGSRTLTYKYGASDTAFRRLRPNHLLFWNAIREACAEQYEWFDFGRSDFPDRGLREFKSGWAAKEDDLVYTTLPECAPTDASGHVLDGARAVIRRSPPWVSRLTGELLYRYAA